MSSSSGSTSFMDTLTLKYSCKDDAKCLELENAKEDACCASLQLVSFPDDYGDWEKAIWAALTDDTFLPEHEGDHKLVCVESASQIDKGIADINKQNEGFFFTMKCISADMSSKLITGLKVFMATSIIYGSF